MQIKNLILCMGNRIGFLVIALGLALLMPGCEKDIHPYEDMDPFDELIVKASDGEAISTSSPTCGEIVLPSGERDILSKGVCWNNPSAHKLYDDVAPYSGKPDSLTTGITGLMPDTNLVNLNDQ